MKILHTVWGFAALAFACAVSCNLLGLSVFTGLFTFYWTLLVIYWRGNKQVG